MATSGWYVAHVRSGREQAMCRAIELACADAQTCDGKPLVEECFSPTYVHRLKFGGTWRDVEERLLPGYVVVVTSDPAALARRLRSVRDLPRLLTFAETFVPLSEDERAWMEGNTKAGSRSMSISVGYREGGVLVITEGPLKGREAMVRRVVRKKCIAIVEVHARNLTITTEVGLALLPAREATRPHDNRPSSGT